MEEAFKLETNFKYTPHIILFTILFTFQYFTKASEIRADLDAVQKKKGDQIFWKYLLAYQTAKAADWCLGPFVYELFEKYHHISIEMVAKMMAISFLSSMVLGPLLVGYINDKADKKFSCVLYGVLMVFSCGLRMSKNPMALIMSQILFGMCSSILSSSFESWFAAKITEDISDPTVKEVVVSSTFEKSMILDSITAVAISFFVGTAKRQFGLLMPYYICMALSITSIFFSGILLDSVSISLNTNDNLQRTPAQPEHNVSDVFFNFWEALKDLYKRPFLIALGITEALLFGILHIFIFVWNPALREMKSDYEAQEVFIVFMIALMVGGSSFRAIYLFFKCNSFKAAKAISLLAVTAFFFANTWISYTTTFYAFVVYEVSVGMLYPSYSQIKFDCLPEKTRGTLMNLFKVPVNLLVVYLLLFINTTLSLKGLVLTCLIFSFIVLIFHFSFFKKEEEMYVAYAELKKNQIPAEGNKKNN